MLITNTPFAVNVIPPSPEASALAKYADIPVSLYSGTPEISIPLYEVRERDIVVPINLSYHASGHKVEDEASRVGLGWSLQAGGLVTRSVRGIPDEYGPDGFLNQAKIAGSIENYLTGTDEDRFRKLDSMVRGCRCVEPDIFYFNFNGYSGKFQFDWDGSIVIASDKKIHIKPIGLNPSDDSFIQGWKIVTPDGLHWLFNVLETTSSRYHDPNEIIQKPCAAIMDLKRPPQAWHLARVDSPFSKRNVIFEYTDYFQTTERWSLETQIHNENLAPSIPSQEKLISDIRGKYLSRILTSWRDTTVDFLPGQERTDVNGSPPLRALGNIKVSNRRGKIVKHWELAYHYDLGRLGLKSLQELNGSQKLPPFQFEYYQGRLPSPISLNQDHWGFPNNNSAQTLIPATVAIRNDGMVNLDGANRLATPAGLIAGMLRKITYPTGGSDTLEFEPHDYSFEQDQPLDVPVTRPMEVGGTAPDIDTPPGEIHTVSIPFTIKEPVELVLTAFFSYGLTFASGAHQPSVSIEDNNGRILFGFLPPGRAIDNDNPCSCGYEIVFNPRDNFVSNTNTFSGHDDCNCRPNPPPQTLPKGSYVFVVKCKKAIAGLNGMNSVDASLKWNEPTGEMTTEVRQGGGVRISRLIRSYDFGNPVKITAYQYKALRNGIEISSGSLLESNYIYQQWMNAIVDVVVDGNIPRGNNILPRFFRFSQNRSALGTTQGSHVGYSQVTVIHGEKGENGKTLYKFTSPIDTPDYRSISVPFPPATSYDYKRGLLLEQVDFAAISNSIVRRITNNYSFSSKSIGALKAGWAIPQVGGSVQIIGPEHLDRYVVESYRNVLGYSRLIKQQTQLYDVANPFITEKTFEYQEDGHKQLTKERRLTNEGWYVTENKYASDYPAGSDNALDLLVNLYVSNALIETVTYREDGLIISAQRNRYSIFDGKALRSQVETAIIEEPFLAQPPYFKAVSNLYEPRYTFRAYDANGNLLEQAEPGGMITSYIWDQVGTQLLAKIDNSAKDEVCYINFEDTTGATADQAFTGFRSLFVSDTYSLPTSLLPKTPGTYLLSYWQKVGQGDWTKKEKRITGYVPGTPIVTDRINGYLDEVRIYPETAHMTTFAYEPLRGIQAQTDVNDIPNIYEYDNFGRLVIARDHNRHILSRFEYVFPEIIDGNFNKPGFIRTHAPLIAGLKTADDVNNADHHQVARSTEYVDGFARAIQKVQHRYSPSLRDTVEIMAYDAFNRKAKQFLPFVGNNGNGEFISPVIANQQLVAFYSSNDELIAKTKAPFSIVRYDGSQLNHMIEQGAPGEAWQPQANPANSHTQRFKFFASTLKDKVFHWRIRNNELVADAYYPNGELRVELTYDEHDTQHAIYFDRDDRKILSGIGNSAPGTNGEELRTYFVYDTKGNLRYVIPPMVVARLTASDPCPTTPKIISSDILKTDCYRYHYDHRNRLVEKGVPNTELTLQIHDRWDRLALTQTGNQRLNMLWTYFKYDAMERLVLSGEVKIPGGRVEITKAMENYYSADRTGERRYERLDSNFRYTNRSFPVLDGTATLDHIIFYDNYKFISILSNPAHFAFKKELEPGTHLLKASGQVTGERLRVLETNQYITKVIYYDHEYRQVQVVSDTHLNGTTRHSQAYTFTGKLLQSLYVQNHGNQNIRIRQEYNYDHAERLTKVHHQVNDQKRIVLYAQTYNSLGQLVRKGLYSNDEAASFAQLVDFRYNIRGWLTSINRLPLVDSGDDKRLFALEQVYNGQSARLNNVPRFDGNISYVTWMNAHFREEQSYVYRYDVFDRLSSALYRAAGDKDGAYELSGTGLPKINYDPNGNILNMARYGFINGERVAIDRLTYSYRGNQSVRVEDASGRSEGFNSAGVTDDAYEYDPNGNLVRDHYKQIQIAYNSKNLINRITSASGEAIRYGHDIADRKLFRDVLATNGTSKLRHDYIDQCIFENGSPRIILHNEGQLIKSANGSEWQYHYHLLDPQGNVRVAFKVEPTASPGGNPNYKVSIVLATDYYPFGLTFVGNQHFDAEVSKVKQRFGNKELQDGLNLDWYDFGARMYDPVLGHWIGVDSLAEKYPDFSPYVFALNNPIRYIDSDGRNPIDWIQENLWIPFIDPRSEYDSKKTKEVVGTIATSIISLPIQMILFMPDDSGGRTQPGYVHPFDSYFEELLVDLQTGQGIENLNSISPRFFPRQKTLNQARRQGGRCEYCGTRLNTKRPHMPNSVQGDHILPWWLEKFLTTLENLAAACKACNLAKGGKTIGPGPNEFWPPIWGPKPKIKPKTKPKIKPKK